ncbi:MAG: metallophosphoesterase [Rhodobacterales bacterium]|nr:metallophosphoesterase [Rhodobacterales bacterium]
MPLVNGGSARPGSSEPDGIGVEVGPRAAEVGYEHQPLLALRLIATSDLHACLLPYDYCANRAVAGRSLSEVSRQIAAARAEVPNSLLFDNGDFLQGNPLADYVASAPRRRRAHPVITAFNTLGYDAVTLGNHEFNYGIGFLSAALAQAQFPVVSANIATRLGTSPARDKTFVPPFAILRRKMVDSAGHTHTLRIGVIGFAPPQIAVWDRDHLGDRIRMRDILASARAWLPRLRARGADVIVALAHSGIGPAEPEDGMENAATALAALPEVDAVIAGHSHLTFPGPGIAPATGIDPVLGLLSGKPAVMPGHSGSHVGIIDLILTHTGPGHRRWKVVAAKARLSEKSVAQVIPAKALRKAIGPDHRAALAWSRRVIGQTRTPLHTHFATIAPSAALDLIAAAKADHARRALAGTEWEDVPVLGSAAPYRAGGRGGSANFTDIPAGVLRMRHLSDLYMFPNTIVALAVTGADLADWLEQSAALFRQIMPGATDASLHDGAMPSFA